MKLRSLVCGLLAFGLVACENPLAITNQNSPDRDRVFTNAKDLEVFISGLFGVWHACTIGGSNDGIHTQALVMGMENTSALANFAMGPRGAIPRSQIDNNRGGQGNAGNYHDWFRCHRAARMGALGVQALGTLSLGSVTADNRARMFARFVQGLALGNLSLTYDSASIVTEATNPSSGAGEIVPLSAYQAVNTAALNYLDSAIAIANANAAAFPLPTTANFWINGQAITQAQFIQIVRSYKALFRANVARTPAARAAVDWAQVIADADNGITADLAPQMDPTNGWDVSWVAQAFATGSANWHQMSQFWLGMADSSGGYDNWLNTAPGSRVAFVVVSADKRIPSGTGCYLTLPCPAAVRTAQQNAAGTGSAGQAFANTPYFRNRPSGEDQPGQTLQISMYDFWRSRAFRQASRIGPYPILTASNIRLLAAEGYLRTNDFATAMTRINVSRTGKGVLPALTGIANGDTTTVVAGGAGCVPRVPNVGTAFKSTKCGNIWDALKWEYRMETAYTGYGNWYYPSRGWGDLPEGTALHWPVPYNEMDTRAEAFYPAGGIGSPTGAARGNYGLFAGGVY